MPIAHPKFSPVELDVYISLCLWLFDILLVFFLVT